MPEIIWVLVIIIFLIITYFLGKDEKSKHIRKKYTIETKHILEDIDRLKSILNDLYNKSVSDNLRRELDLVRSEIEGSLEQKTKKLLLEIPELNEWNEHNRFGILHELNEGVENIEQELSEIEDKIYSEPSYNDREETIKTLTKALYQRLELKEYQYIIENNEKLWMFFYKQIDDIELKRLYIFTVWTAYQEVWNIKYSSKYFEAYFECLDMEEDKKTKFLMKELNDLWLSYKTLQE